MVLEAVDVEEATLDISWQPQVTFLMEEMEVVGAVVEMEDQTVEDWSLTST